MSQTVIVGDAGSLKDAQLNMSGVDGAAMREQRRQVREMATKAFYAQALAFQSARLVIMLDTCEWLSEPEALDVGQWVTDELMPGIHERMAKRRHPCSMVIASRTMLPLTLIEQNDRRALTLPRLEQAAVDLYLQQVGMQDAVFRGRVYQITHGHALCVSIIGVLWQEQEDQAFTLADLPPLHAHFNERALLEYIRERLDKRLKTPFRELTRYGVLLRSFNLPMLRAVFPELLPDAEELDCFHQLISYPYVEMLGNQHYAFHDLLREIQAADRAYMMGRFYYSGYGLQLDMALVRYKEAYSIYQQVGDRLGEANSYLAQGRIALEQEEYQTALSSHNQANELYQQIQDRYSQARLLYYRCFVYEEMKQQQQAILDANEGLAIAKALFLPFIDLFEERLKELQSLE